MSPEERLLAALKDVTALEASDLVDDETLEVYAYGALAMCDLAEDDVRDYCTQWTSPRASEALAAIAAAAETTSRLLECRNAGGALLLTRGDLAFTLRRARASIESALAEWTMCWRTATRIER